MQAKQEISEERETSALPLGNRGRTTEQADAPSGDTLRVTPEEVALAAAALEAKRDAEHTWRETTLPLDEAIQHLGLNATAAELEPEVLALRAEQSRRDAKMLQKHLAHRRALGAKIGAGLALAGILGAIVWSGRAQAPKPQAVTPAALTDLPIQKLEATPENVPVHIDVDTLLKLAKGNVTPESVSVDTRAAGQGAQAETMFANEWTLVKSKGEILVQGWATVEFALNISNGSTGALFSARPAWIPPNNLVPVQVPVSRLEGQSYGRYMADGKAATGAATSVLMEIQVADTSTVARELVLDALTSDKELLPAINTERTNFDVKFSHDTIQITGRADTEALKAHIGQIATSTLQRLKLPYKVSNDLDIAHLGDSAQ